MFRVLDNIPEVYIAESRDFLILARLYDTLFSGVRYDIDTMVNLLDATSVKDRMLDLLCTKVGFFPRIQIDATILKYIVASFPYIMKNKGNVDGVHAAVNTILKAESTAYNETDVEVVVNNTKDDEVYKPYTVYIFTKLSIYNKQALKELLRYVLPSGYNYLLYDKTDLTEDPILSQFKQEDTLRIFATFPYSTSAIGTSDTYALTDNKRAQNLLGYATTELITSDTLVVNPSVPLVQVVYNSNEDPVITDSDIETESPSTT